MAKFSDKDDYEKRKTAMAGRTGPSSAEDAYHKATELHQHGDLSGAVRLYEQIIEKFPGSPKAELAKAMVAGLQKEKSEILWSTALDARSQCNAQEALKLYRKIIEDFPGSPEASSARTEIKRLSEIQPSWDEALAVQSQGNESRALDIYGQIVEKYPNSPEAENAGLLIAIIHQNQLMPRGEVTQDFKFGKNTPEIIISHLLAHKKATSGSGELPVESMREEQKSQKIERLWTQAGALENDGHIDEALILYKKIIDTSTNGSRVRDAKYRIEKIKARSAGLQKSYGLPEQWGLTPDKRTGILQRAGGAKALVAVAVILVIIVAGLLAYRANKPAAWLDVVEDAKKAIAIVKTAAGPGTGFLVSKDGLIITNARLVGKDKVVDIRLYSGALKKATVVKAGINLLDIAVLKIDGLYDHYLTMAESDECTEGTEIRVLGAPLGMEYFITKGIISHCNQERDGVRYIQTDPAMNVGQSGGPGLNRQGKVIGLSTTITLGDDANGLNLMLPITIVKDFMEGKLVALEEALTKKEEENARAIEERKKKLYADIENINKKLQGVSSLERDAYLRKMIDLLNQNRVTRQQADLMVEQVKYGPAGNPMGDWVQSLALKVAKGELPEDSAIQLIKRQYKLW